MSKERAHFPSPAEELSPKFKVVDHSLISVLAKRNELALQVGEFKDRKHTPKIVRERESERLKAIGGLATKLGVDPDFARSILWMVIAESCKLQTEQSETRPIEEVVAWQAGANTEWLKYLKQSLLDFTRRVTQVYESEMYGDGSRIATKLYLDFEWTRIEHEIALLRAHKCLGVALDLGCATGRLTRKLTTFFKKTIGCDLCPHMLQAAKQQPLPDGSGQIEYHEIDLDKGLSPIAHSSIDFVVMNLGTASEVPELRPLLTAINRVLTPNGRFLLSFYNEAALLYQWFVPWQPSLQAAVNKDKHYLEVSFEGKVYPVFARLYDRGHIFRILSKANFEVSELFSYPTIASILPNSVLSQLSVQRSTQEIDRKLAPEMNGAYLIVTGKKKSLDTI